MSADQIALIGRLDAELIELERVLARAERLMAKARAQGDEDYLDGAALNLHSFYAGAERIFEEIAREIDGSVPTGPEWHRDLLMQMSAELRGTRPPVIGRNTRDCLDNYRGFRHVVRNVYTFNLRPSRLQELADEARPCYSALVEDMTRFYDFLEKQELAQT
ncbi:MAG: hypothetical protein CVU38_02825 [Chloroflexi bacterium HGW-Chloroflexi-1]|nr:MAG: hypothetical protein CVU38_02825 [Chloroflexi bacterium HGW-Chloroflexi-1]